MPPSAGGNDSSMLDDLVGWVERHIEQGRVLQDNAERIGIVDTIAGYVHADIEIRGRADHAGATPMDASLRRAGGRAQAVVTVERLASAHHGTVGTVGSSRWFRFRASINAVPGRAPALARHSRCRRVSVPRRRQRHHRCRRARRR